MTPALRDPWPAACHCGAVRFEVTLSDGLNTARRCDCSFCAMRGAVVVSAPLDGVRILKGAEHLALYQFGTHAARHHFCTRCGIYTHHNRRSNPNQIGVNAACLEGLSPFDFESVEVLNGRQHPSDGGNDGPAGVLYFRNGGDPAP